MRTTRKSRSRCRASRRRRSACVCWIPSRHMCRSDATTATVHTRCRDARWPCSSSALNGVSAAQHMSPRRPAEKRGSRAPMRTDGAGTRDERASRRPSRVVVENVQPQIDAGRFPIKRTVGEPVFVTADVFADGHDKLSGVLKHRRGGGEWHEAPLTALGNDSWGASFVVTELGEYEYSVEAWIDHFGSWLSALVAKTEAGEDVESELLQGAAIVERAATAGAAREEADDGGVRITSEVRLKPDHEVRLKPDTTYDTPRHSDVVSGFSRSDEDARLQELAKLLRSSRPQSARVAAARDPEIERLMRARPDRSASTTVDQPLQVVVDPVRARFGAWYEMFPRSCTSDANRGGTLRDAEGRLSDIAAMGFDVLYLPPVHPIGTTNRKGRNNALTAAPSDPGSPWAIGSETGGHTAIDPGLGTLDDFDRFVATGQHLGLQVALDIAFQASPDHPWAKTHPQWFQRRPDGTIKYAENPPKKYQDIYPFDFESEDWRALWEAL